MQIPKNGRPAWITLSTAWRIAPPPRSSPAAQAPNAPCPGTTSLSARATASASSLIVDARAHRGQRLLDAAQVAASQIGDDDGRVRAHDVSVPLVDGTPTTRGSRRAAAEVARANALNSASIMWCAFSP